MPRTIRRRWKIDEANRQLQDDRDREALHRDIKRQARQAGPAPTGYQRKQENVRGIHRKRRQIKATRTGKPVTYTDPFTEQVETFQPETPALRYERRQTYSRARLAGRSGIEAVGRLLDERQRQQQAAAFAQTPEFAEQAELMHRYVMKSPHEAAGYMERLRERGITDEQIRMSPHLGAIEAIAAGQPLDPLQKLEASIKLRAKYADLDKQRDRGRARKDAENRIEVLMNQIGAVLTPEVLVNPAMKVHYTQFMGAVESFRTKDPLPVLKTMERIAKNVADGAVPEYQKQRRIEQQATMKQQQVEEKEQAVAFKEETKEYKAEVKESKAELGKFDTETTKLKKELFSVREKWAKGYSEFQEKRAELTDSAFKKFSPTGKWEDDKHLSFLDTRQTEIEAELDERKTERKQLDTDLKTLKLTPPVQDQGPAPQAAPQGQYEQPRQPDGGESSIERFVRLQERSGKTPQTIYDADFKNMRLSSDDPNKLRPDEVELVEFVRQYIERNGLIK